MLRYFPCHVESSDHRMVLFAQLKSAGKAGRLAGLGRGVQVATQHERIGRHEQTLAGEGNGAATITRSAPRMNSCTRNFAVGLFSVSSLSQRYTMLLPRSVTRYPSVVPG